MSKFTAWSLALAAVVCAGLAFPVARADDKPPEPQKPATEHAILKGFVGEWDCDTEITMGPGQTMKSKGTMTGKMIGDMWAVVNMKGEMAGQAYQGQGTFGYDATKSRKYVGTWVDSMGDFLWHYSGKVEGTKLMLDAKGPSPLDPTKMVDYIDTWEFKNKDEIILTSQMPGPDGKMFQMMKCVCKRKK